MSQLDDDLIDDDAAARLLVELGDALAAEITNEHVDAATSAFWIARTDALVAELDEMLEEGQLSSVRGAGDTRQHVYRLDSLAVSLTVDAVDHRVDGKIEGPYSSAQWLDQRGASRPLDLDERGRFRVSHSAGPAAVEVAMTDGRVVRTRWTLL